ncbi:helix-turn-helix domain-containing protein [Sphingobacterium paludis]|uniref:Helix-turn-helix protein n=1 Tax=Sphingobacterium paludis TaxID=1476465 RepID=A0A4R7D1B2_9SPHI|nr:helix-turn-helix domain-containing protein [Sphingobacterium paludis]TDS14753.1 helix-turn-helix protein [Sphingobacterium paludis]
MNPHTYPIETIAAAMELLHAGNTIAMVAQHFGCSVATVSRWYIKYLGYRGREGFSITLQSKNWNIDEFADN